MGRPRGSVSRGPFRSQGTCLGVFSAHYLIQVGYEVEPLAEYSTIHPSGEYLVPYLVSEDASALAGLQSPIYVSFTPSNPVLQTFYNGSGLCSIVVGRVLG